MAHELWTMVLYLFALVNMLVEIFGKRIQLLYVNIWSEKIRHAFYRKEHFVVRRKFLFHMSLYEGTSNNSAFTVSTLLFPS